MISQLVGKAVPEVEAYSLVFWQRVDELSDRDRIIKQISNGEEKISNRRLHQ